MLLEIPINLNRIDNFFVMLFLEFFFEKFNKIEELLSFLIDLMSLEYFLVNIDIF